MKKYIFLLLVTMLFCLPSKVNAQIAGGSPSKMWQYPAVAALDEQVTWYFDMTGSAFTAGMDIYLWDWSPTEPDAGNWANSSAFAKLNYEGNMVWSMTLTPTLYFNVSVQAILASPGFWLRLKDLTGTIQSDVLNMPITATTITSFASSGNPTLISPSSYTLGYPVSILVNTNNVATSAGLGALTNLSNIYFNSGLNDFDSTATNVKVNFKDPANLTKTQFKNLGNGIYKFDMVPSKYYNVQTNYPLTDIAFTIKGLSGNDTIIGTAIGGTNFTFSAIPVVPKTPVLNIFPTEFTQNDIIVLDRENNEASVSKLSYVLTAGTVILKGDFIGTSSSLKAYINLLTQLAGQQNLASIHLLISDNNGRVLLDSDIPLVPLSKLD